tara:strand:- start:1366 stop:1587 length:222 start_codon:yes stop_codon:yes gene_type:complete
MLTSIVVPKFESFEACIANQSLYAGLSRKRKDQERKERNANLYLKQMILHPGKYTPSAITAEKIEKYKQTKNI